MNGITPLIDILQQNLNRVNVATLCLSILGCVAISDEVRSEENRTLVRDTLISNNTCTAVVNTLHRSLSHPYKGRSGDAWRVTEKSLAAISAICEFDPDLCSTMVEKNASCVCCRSRS